jgi:hypothetical protein
VIDSMGRIVNALRHHAGAIDAMLPARLPPTLFARFGLSTSALFGLCRGVLGLIFRIVAGTRAYKRGSEATTTAKDPLG